MKITIDPLDGKSIDKAIAKIKEYQAKIREKEEQLVSRLAEYGAIRSQILFSGAVYDGTNDVVVTSRVDGNRAYIIANGQSVAFIEFGTGKTFKKDYPLPKPQGIVGIGEYGYGLGKLNSWRYPASHGLGVTTQIDPKHTGYVITQGNPPNMALYKTILELQPMIEQVAREVFND